MDPMNFMAGVGLSMTSTTLILRLIARHKQKLSFGLDDYLAVLAWFVFTGANVAALITAYDESLQVSHAIFGGVLCSTVALGCGRLSAVFFYRRIFHTRKQDMFDIVTKIMIGLLLLWTIYFFLSTLLACGANVNLAATGQTYFPVSNNYGEDCISQYNQVGLAVSSLLLDLLVLILPLPKIWALHAPRARKIAISCVFLIAFISFGASGFRVYAVLMMGVMSSDYPNSIALSTFFYQLVETAACLTAINMPSIWYFSHHLKSERVRRIIGGVLSFSSTKLRRSAEKSDTKPLKNESMELSDNEAIPTRRAALEPESRDTISQDKLSGRDNYYV